MEVEGVWKCKDLLFGKDDLAKSFHAVCFLSPLTHVLPWIKQIRNSKEGFVITALLPGGVVRRLCINRA